MIGKVIAITVCERCGETRQSEVGVHRGTDEQYDPTFRYAKPPTGWEDSLVCINGNWFKVAMQQVVPDTIGVSDEGWMFGRVDLCPTCRMSLATWWLEGKRT